MVVLTGNRETERRGKVIAKWRAKAVSAVARGGSRWFEGDWRGPRTVVTFTGAATGGGSTSFNRSALLHNGAKEDGAKFVRVDVVQPEESCIILA